jgi:hypothetical protein
MSFDPLARTDSAPRLDFSDDPHTRKALRTWVIASVLFVVIGVTIGIVIGEEKGYGAGPWDGRNVWSCYTPGGPYYVSNVPRAQQPCPNNTSTPLRWEEK